HVVVIEPFEDEWRRFIDSHAIPDGSSTHCEWKWRGSAAHRSIAYHPRSERKQHERGCQQHAATVEAKCENISEKHGRKQCWNCQAGRASKQPTQDRPFHSIAQRYKPRSEKHDSKRRANQYRIVRGDERI